MTETKKYCLVILGLDWFGESEYVENTMFVFDDEDSAYAYAASLLVINIGEISRQGRGFIYEDVFHDSDKSLVADYQNELIGSEYFHVYGCVLTASSNVADESGVARL